MYNQTPWTIYFGTSVRLYYTEHHAFQMCRALLLNHTKFVLVEPVEQMRSLTVESVLNSKALWELESEG